MRIPDITPIRGGQTFNVVPIYSHLANPHFTFTGTYVLAMTKYNGKSIWRLKSATFWDGSAEWRVDNPLSKEWMNSSFSVTELFPFRPPDSRTELSLWD